MVGGRYAPARTNLISANAESLGNFFRSKAKASIANAAFFFFSKRFSESKVGRGLSQEG